MSDLPKYVEFEDCGYGCCWWCGNAPLFGGPGPVKEILNVDVPASAERLYAIPMKRPTRNSFQVTEDGDVIGLLHDICEEWRSLVRRYYRAGYRAVRFEYE